MTIDRMKTAFIWLGAGRVRKHPVGEDVRLLDSATKAGLPVPSGGVLLDDFYQLLLEAGLIQVVGQKITVPNPDWLHGALYEDVRFPKMSQPVVVRSQATAVSPPIPLPPPLQLTGDFTNPTELAKMLTEIWTPTVLFGEGVQHNVLVMERVEKRVWGTAVTQKDNAFDEAIYTENAASHTLQLPQITGWQSADKALTPFAQRLQMLLRGVRRTLGKGEWRITWADDGKVCWLI